MRVGPPNISPAGVGGRRPTLTVNSCSPAPDPPGGVVAIFWKKWFNQVQNITRVAKTRELKPKPLLHKINSLWCLISVRKILE